MTIFHDTTSSYLLLLLGILIYSFDSTLTLLNEGLTEWTIIFWRQLFQLSVVLLFTFVYNLYNELNAFNTLYTKLTRIGYMGFVAGFFDAVCGITYVIACLYTYTANVFLIYSSSTLMTAILSYYFLDEIVHFRTYVAAVIISICVGFIFYFDLTTESEDNDDVGSQGTNWYGNLMALISAISFSIYMVIIRKASKSPIGDVDMIPVIIISALFQCVIASCFGVDYSSPSSYNYAYIFLQGGIASPLYNSIMIWAAKHIPATEVSLMLLLDTILQPMWVWVFGLSTPPTTTLIIGSLIICTMFVHTYLDIVGEDDNKAASNYMIYNSIADTDMDDDAKSMSVETPTRRNRNYL